ncbi:MAG: alpha/beta hydrolase [Chloroflexi bacterium]|nr:alpha/beta hydrolase [Chloroflexota bacterium]
MPIIAAPATPGKAVYNGVITSERGRAMPKLRIDPTLEMHYEVDDFADPWSQPQVAILHHGVGKSGRLWYAWVPHLARHFRVYRPDARGFGQSSVPPSEYHPSLNGFVQDLRAFMDKLGIQKAHLVGETFGGTICLKFAHDYPERVRSLVFCAAPYTFADLKPRLPEELRLLREEGTPAWAKFTNAGRFNPEQVPPGLSEWYLGEMSMAHPRVMIGVISQLAGIDLTPLLPEVRVPTLIMGGEKSILAPPPRLEAMKQVMPKAEVTIIPGAQHHIQTAFADRCAQEAATFMLKAAASG